MIDLRNKQNTFKVIILCTALFLIAFTGCSSQEELWVYKPMISIGDDLFGDTGHTKSNKHRKAEELIMKGQEIKIIGENDFEELVKL